jgi:hypothetical protein
LIEATLDLELYLVIAAKAQDMDGFVHAIGSMADHAHPAGSQVESMYRNGKISEFDI